MASYTQDQKREIIKWRIEKGLSTIKLSKKFGMNVESVRQLIHRYELHGEKAITQTYMDYKVEDIIKIMWEVYDGSSKVAVAIKYNTVPGRINKRIKMYGKNVYNCPKERNKERTKSAMSNPKKVLLTDSESELKIKKLEERNLELEAEVEALKKLRALVLQRNARQLKKKQ